MNNYPPGVTGSEPQIVGYPDPVLNLEIGTEFIFHTPFDQFADRRGQKAIIIGLINENTEEVDVDEVGPMYRIRFSDGFETEAWPEEVEESDWF